MWLRDLLKFEYGLIYLHLLETPVSHFKMVLDFMTKDVALNLKLATEDQEGRLQSTGSHFPYQIRPFELMYQLLIVICKRGIVAHDIESLQKHEMECLHNVQRLHCENRCNHFRLQSYQYFGKIFPSTIKTASSKAYLIKVGQQAESVSQELAASINQSRKLVGLAPIPPPKQVNWSIFFQNEEFEDNIEAGNQQTQTMPLHDVKGDQDSLFDVQETDMETTIDQSSTHVQLPTSKSSKK